MANDQHHSEPLAETREYEPPAVTPIGSVDALTAQADDSSSLHDADPA